MSLEATKSSYRSKLAQLGRGALHALFPNDFEFYSISLELVDSQGNTVDYFIWPINPNEIRENHPEITNIRKTIGGVNVLKNSTFNPRTISIRGNFGRDFLVLIGGQEFVFAGFGASIRNGKFSITPPSLLDNPVPQFSTFIKTGYGCVKLLQAIKDKSKGLDEWRKPYSLYLYNPILGNNYQVEFRDFSPSQDVQNSNMLPTYNLTLTAVASLDNVFSRRVNLKSGVKLTALTHLQKTANTLANNLKISLGT